MNSNEFFIAALAIVAGAIIIILPLLAVTARYAIKPILETWATMRGSQAGDERIHLLERRLELLEEQIQLLERSHARLEEAADFHERLSR